jgi:hypothetical protein
VEYNSIIGSLKVRLYSVGRRGITSCSKQPPDDVETEEKRRCYAPKKVPTKDTSMFIGYIHNTPSAIVVIPCSKVGRDNVASIATRNRLGGSGIESRSGQDFPRLSIPVLGPTQLSIQWVPVLSRR